MIDWGEHLTLAKAAIAKGEQELSLGRPQAGIDACPPREEARQGGLSMSIKLSDNDRAAIKIAEGIALCDSMVFVDPSSAIEQAYCAGLRAGIERAAKACESSMDGSTKSSEWHKGLLAGIVAIRALLR